jgi:hypothetical protein
MKLYDTSKAQTSHEETKLRITKVTSARNLKATSFKGVGLYIEITGYCNNTALWYSIVHDFCWYTIPEHKKITPFTKPAPSYQA